MRISDWSSDVCSSDLPVILDPRISSSIIGHLLGAIAGTAIARGTSFLLGKEERMLFDSGIVIRDEPHLAPGLRSRAFDGEGLPTAARDIVADRTITGWLLRSEEPTSDLQSLMRTSSHGFSVKKT